MTTLSWIILASLLGGILSVIAAALFALNMFLTSERGGCHADVDHVAWLEELGFTDSVITRPTPPMVHTVVRAIRA